MTKEQRFWKWFSEHEDDLMHFERDTEAIFDSLEEQLQKVHPDLTFEFGPNTDEKREFVISAGGIKEAFPAVPQLVSAAPRLQRWKITAFRPRTPVGGIMELGGIRVDLCDVDYTLVRSQDSLGIYLFIPGYRKDDSRFGQIGYLLLDEALGEYDVETKVGMIKMFAKDAKVRGKRYPLSELAEHFDRAFTHL